MRLARKNKKTRQGPLEAPSFNLAAFSHLTPGEVKSRTVTALNFVSGQGRRTKTYVKNHGCQMEYIHNLRNMGGITNFARKKFWDEEKVATATRQLRQRRKIHQRDINFFICPTFMEAGILDSAKISPALCCAACTLTRITT